MITLREFKSLHRIVDQIFAEASAIGVGWPQLAQKAGLGYETVRRLGSYDTMYPRAQTIAMLAQAVGLQITLESKRANARTQYKKQTPARRFKIYA